MEKEKRKDKYGKRKRRFREKIMMGNKKSLALLVILLILETPAYAYTSHQISFITIGDPHIKNNISEDQDQRLIDIVKYINNINVDFVVVMGDIVNDGTDVQFKTAKSILANLNKPYYVVEGNHDIIKSPQTFVSYFGPDEHIEYIKGYQLLFAGTRNNGRSLDWVFDFSKADKNMPTLMFVHGVLTNPPTGCNCAWGPFFKYAASMQPELDSFKDVIGVYSGHVHRDTDQTFKGVRYISINGLLNGSIGSFDSIASDNVGYSVITDDKLNYNLVNYYQNVSPPTIVSHYPISPIVGQYPSTVAFNITLDKTADIDWQFDGISKGQNFSVTNSDFINTAYVGTHDVIANVKDSYGSNSFKWLWNVIGTFTIAGNVPSVYIGIPTNVTFTVTRECGIEKDDNCSGINIPVQGAKITLSGDNITGYGMTDINGQTILSINATDNNTITATTTKDWYNSNYTTITPMSIIFTTTIPIQTNPTTTIPIQTTSTQSISGKEGNPNGGGNEASVSSSSGGISGGSGGIVSGEPYDNILKFESQENFISTIPVEYKYSIPEVAVYGVNITGNQSDDATLRIEVLKNKSALVEIPAQDIVYKNINMWINSKKIKNATIKYKVENSWMNINGVSADTIKMVRWDNSSKKWNQLSTNVVRQDDTYTYFESKTDGFSHFAISGVKDENTMSTASINVTIPIEKNKTQNTEISDSPIVFPTKAKGFEIIIAVVAIFVIYTLRKR